MNDFTHISSVFSVMIRKIFFWPTCLEIPGKVSIKVTPDQFRDESRGQDIFMSFNIVNATGREINASIAVL